MERGNREGLNTVRHTHAWKHSRCGRLHRLGIGLASLFVLSWARAFIVDRIRRHYFQCKSASDG